MNASELREIILEELGKVAPGSDPHDLEQDENVREGLDIDSFDHLNFLIGLHERLGVDIPEKDYGKLNTVGEILEYLSAVQT
jgi:acyl carrier protein